MAAKKTTKKAPAKKAVAKTAAPKAAVKKAPAKKVAEVKPAAKKAVAKAPAKKAPAAAKKETVSQEQFFAMVSEAAYFAAQNDGNKKGSAEYWVEAEAAVRAKFNIG